MSTRCQIGFYQNLHAPLAKPNAIIYRHSDGYPDTEHGVIDTIVPLLRKHKALREFWDAEYIAAYCLARWLDDPQCCLGYGVTQRLHSDIDYYYAVYEQYIVVYTAHYLSMVAKITFDDLEEHSKVGW